MSFETRIVLDGGAYRSSSFHVTANAACFAAGPYRVPNALRRGVRRAHQQPAVRRDARVRRGAGVRSRTRPRWICSPPPAASTRSSCGCATRSRPVTSCSPVSASTGTLPVAEVIRACADAPAAARGRRRRARRDPVVRAAPATRSTCGAASGFAVGFKNLMYAEGYDDYSTARCSLDRRRRHRHVRGGGGRAGLRHPRAAVRAHHPGRRRCGRGARGHVDRVGRLHVGEPSDDDVGRRGGTSVPGRARAGARARRARAVPVAGGARHRRRSGRQPRRHRRPAGGRALPGRDVRGDRGVPPHG